MQRWSRPRPSPDAPPPRRPHGRSPEEDEVAVDLLLEAAIRRAGRAHWVAGRDARRWAVRAALASVAVVALLLVAGFPPAVLSPAAAGAAVAVLVWADHASRAWRCRNQHQHELAAIATAVRAHAGGHAATTLLVEGAVPRSGDLTDLRAAAMTTIDEAGCRSGHTELCRHRRPAVTR